MTASNTPNKRLAFLEKTTAEGSTDPLAWYGLAMEYRKLERWDEALQTFTQLRTMKPDYVAMYLMCGQMLEGIADGSDALLLAAQASSFQASEETLRVGDQLWPTEHKPH